MLDTLSRASMMRAPTALPLLPRAAITECIHATSRGQAGIPIRVAECGHEHLGVDIISPSLRSSPEAALGGYTVLRAILQDGMRRAVIRATIRLPMTPGGQILEFISLPGIC